MTYIIGMMAIAGSLFVAMLLALEGGRRIGLRRRAVDPDGATAGIGAVDGAVFGLLGLLLAFTFSGAATRFDWRRELIVQESNAIGTAYLRLDLLPSDTQAPLRENFRRYVDSRLAAYANVDDMQAAMADYAHSQQLQNEIWIAAVNACRAGNYVPATTLLLPALNDMIDITNARTIAARTHPPTVIFVMLFGIALCSSVLAGHSMGAGGGVNRSWVHVVGFALTMALSTYVILDIEYPRRGLIRVDDFDQALVEVRAAMK